MKMPEKDESLKSQSIFFERECEGSIYLLKTCQKVSATDLLLDVGLFAQDQGLAFEGFGQSLIEREKQYPTGILGIKGMAIPHTNQKFSRNESMIVVTCEKPILFNSMVNPEQVIEVSIVFFLLTIESKSHIQLLETLARFMQNQQLLLSLFEENGLEILKENFKMLL